MPSGAVRFWRIAWASSVVFPNPAPAPHRAPLDQDRASRELRAEVTAGRLDGDAVNAVLGAAGRRAPARR
jgi:hypothetical protein